MYTFPCQFLITCNISILNHQNQIGSLQNGLIHTLYAYVNYMVASGSNVHPIDFQIFYQEDRKVIEKNNDRMNFMSLCFSITFLSA